MEYANWALHTKRQTSKCKPNDNELKTGKNYKCFHIFD